VRGLVRVVIDGVHPERVVAVAIERGEQVVPRDARGEAEAGDRLRDVRERVTALEADEQRPGRDEEPPAARLGPAVHLAQVGLRTLPALAVGLAVHVAIPPRGVASDPIRLHPVPHEREEPEVQRPQPPLVVVTEHAPAVEDPVVQVGLARLERLRADGVVQHHAVDHHVRLQGEHGLEQVADGGKVVAAAAAVEDLPVPGLRPRVEQAMQDARVRVLLLDPHAFGEGVPDDGHAHDARPAGPDLRGAELLRAVAALDRVGRAGGRLVETRQPQGPIFLERLRVVEVDVEVAARVARIAVQEDAAPAVGDAVRVLEARRGVSGETKDTFGGQESEDNGGGGEAKLRTQARKRCHPSPMICCPSAVDAGRLSAR